MGDILRKAVEVRRKELINTLITYNLNQEENQHLFELTLTELENEYRKLQSQGHPHSGLSSIQWKEKKLGNSLLPIKSFKHIVIHIKQDH